jgi:predicted GH43/DUF377 family glycosyl hydrolase
MLKINMLIPLFLLLTSLSAIGQLTNSNKASSTIEISPLLFSYTKIPGIGHEQGCTRRDPSDVILVDNTYYVYYTKVYGKSAGYWGTLWCASSTDNGFTWKEEGEVLGIGESGTFDSQATFTPNIIKAKNKYYLFYTGVKPTPGRIDGIFENNSTTDITAIGLAVADAPSGPFTRISKEPILEVSTEHEKFDSYRIDDASLLFRHGKYWLYYKGRSRKHGQGGPAHTQMGVAFSENIEGPFEKYSKPILPTSHEVLIWPFKNGVAALASISSTLEFSPNGLDFLTDKRAIKVENRPNAPGAFRPELTQLPSNENGINWGISMIHNGDEAYLIRYDCENK